MPLHRHEDSDDIVGVRPQYALLRDLGDVPKTRLAPRAMPASAAYQIVHDELLLDGQARLNMATFVTTWMEPEAAVLMGECASKNMIDKDEYPQTAELERRCVNILAGLWHAPPQGDATGCSTTGSSEACMLAGLALKRRWEARRRAAGLDTARPNLVMGTNVQVCWEKFCRYWDVEARQVPVGPDTTHLTADGAVGACDDRTIGVVAILGSTFDGAYEPVANIAAGLDRLAADGPDVPIHVDGASGGFVAPFIDPEMVWDFRVPRVASINASGHKFGLVYPGVGWIVWRDAAALPEELVFKVDYLGGEMPTFALNFSRPGAQVVAQYYMFLRLGFDGYRQVQQESRETADWLAQRLSQVGPFELVSGGPGIPAVAFRLKEGTGYTVYDVSEAVRSKGWIVPAYPMPANLDKVDVLRVVVRNGMSRDLAESLVADLSEVASRLDQGWQQASRQQRTGFHH